MKFTSLLKKKKKISLKITIKQKSILWFSSLLSVRPQSLLTSFFYKTDFNIFFYQYYSLNLFYLYKKRGKLFTSPFINNRIKFSYLNYLVIEKHFRKSSTELKLLKKSGNLMKSSIVKFYHLRHLELRSQFSIMTILPIPHLYFYSFLLDYTYLWQGLLTELHATLKNGA